jgi:tRNA uridine 5-carboxymethylaminomethyl modification enzyme
LRRPEVNYASLMSLSGAGPGVSDAKVVEQIEVQAKYHGYIERQRCEIAHARTHAETPIPRDFDYATVRGLSTEVRQRLTHIRPETVGQASRISGVTPAAVSLLLVYLKRRRVDSEPRDLAGHA